MREMDVIIAVVLLCIGAGMVVYFLRILLQPLFGWLAGSKGLFRFRKYSLRLDRADQLINEEKWVEALDELRKAPFLEIVFNPALIAASRDHNQSVLSRILIIAESIGSKPEYLATVETLFLDRTELLTAYTKVTSAQARIKSKRKESGKALPDWTAKDFQQQKVEIKEELEQNHKNLKVALKHLFDSIEKASEPTIVYH